MLAHIEMQTVKDSRLAERMFGYCHRIYDRYKVPVAGFAALGDESGRRQVPQPDSQSDRFGWEALGSELSWRFQTVRLMDWESRWDELLASRNPFAIVLMAYIRTKSTRNHPESRLGFKIAIARHLHATQPATEVPGLMRLLDWMMQLPEQHAIIFSEEIATLQTEHQMTYIPSFARGAWEDGRKDGQLSVLIQLLTRRFGQLPAAAQTLLDSAKSDAIEQWTDRLLEARSLEEVFGVPLPPRSRPSRRQTA